MQASIPAGAATGADYLIAQITEPSGVTPVASSTTLDVQPAMIDLTGSFVSATPTVKIGKSMVIDINVINEGNVPAVGQLPIQLDLSTIGSSDPSPVALPPLQHPLNLKPNRPMKLVLHAVISGVADGSYYVLVDLDPANKFKDVNVANNSFASSSAVITVTG